MRVRYYLHWHISSAEDREDAFIVVPSVNIVFWYVEDTQEDLLNSKW